MPLPTTSRDNSSFRESFVRDVHLLSSSLVPYLPSPLRLASKWEVSFRVAPVTLKFLFDGWESLRFFLLHSHSLPCSLQRVVATNIILDSGHCLLYGTFSPSSSASLSILLFFLTTNSDLVWTIGTWSNQSNYFKLAPQRSLSLQMIARPWKKSKKRWERKTKNSIVSKFC